MNNELKTLTGTTAQVIEANAQRDGFVQAIARPTLKDAYAESYDMMLVVAQDMLATETNAAFWIETEKRNLYDNIQRYAIANKSRYVK